MTLTCLCGDVTLSLAERPEFIHACNCTLCSKTGARWGYFGPETVCVTGATTAYSRGDQAAPNAAVQFCPTCGVTTHFVLTPDAIAQVGNTMMGVNMALAAPDQLAGIEQRYPDGRGWPGAGPFTYRREAEVLG